MNSSSAATTRATSGSTTDGSAGTIAGSSGRGNRVLVEALYSAAGTAVNQKILDPNRPPVEVHDGDHLWVGPEHFQFVIESDAHARTRPPSGSGRRPTRADVEPADEVRAAAEPPGEGRHGGPVPGGAPAAAAAARRRRPTAKAGEPEPSRRGRGRRPKPVGTFVVTQMDGVAAGPAPPEGDRRGQRHPLHHRGARRADRLGPELHHAPPRQRRAAIEPGPRRGLPGLPALQGRRGACSRSARSRPRWPASSR